MITAANYLIFVLDCPIGLVKTMQTKVKALAIRNRIVAIIVLSFLMFASEIRASYAQLYADEFHEVEALQSKDTVIRIRRDGAFRFGITAGGSANYYVGSLKIERIINSLKQGLIDVTSGDGAGYFLGGFAEYLPPGSDLGAALRVNVIDSRFSNGTSDPDNIDSSLHYISHTKVNYLSISPEFRYNLPLNGLHLIAGIDLDFATSHESSIGKEFLNVGAITDLRKDTIFTPQSFRIGGHVGIGYDIFSANLQPSMRFRVTPFITLQTGSNVASYLGSSWNSITGKAGIALKISFDDVKDSIIPFNPNYIEPPRYIASVQYERGVSLAEARGSRIEVYDLTVSAIEVSGEEIPNIQTITSQQTGQAEMPVRNSGETIAATELPGVTNTESAQQGITNSNVPAVAVSPNTDIPFSFTTSTSLNLPTDARKYLDAVAEYLKANPNSTVRIVGHTDNVGSSGEQQSISERRAQQAVDYLRRKGIAQRRIFPSALGARQPIADNATEAGRRRNRRVEVRVVQ